MSKKCVDGLEQKPKWKILEVKVSLAEFSIQNYRSIKHAWLKLDRMNVIVGPNGSGKSNLYRAIYLLASTASGRLARNVAEEGGMSSVLWSGERSSDSKKVELSVKLDNLQYDLTFAALSAALGGGKDSVFKNDVEILKEEINIRSGQKRTCILKRNKAAIYLIDAKGVKVDYTMRVPANESILFGIREPHRFPQLSALRQAFLSWRFYHHFRTDKESPLRRPQLAVMTPRMAHDGSDFVSAIATILQWGDKNGLLNSLDDAFPGSDLAISESASGLRVLFKSADLRRAFQTHELSDGTLQYLCLLAALYSLDPPSVLVLNEPETSLHPDLSEPLARLLVAASHRSQVWITTHSRDLADAIVELSGYSPIELEKVEGETKLMGVSMGRFRESFQLSEDDD
jgi:predicted ATPase